MLLMRRTCAHCFMDNMLLCARVSYSKSYAADHSKVKTNVRGAQDFLKNESKFTLELIRVQVFMYKTECSERSGALQQRCSVVYLRQN